MTDPKPESSFTGRQRRRTTHWSVKFKDRLSHAIITVGGLGTIIAVTTVFFFLVSVVVPLFRSPTTEKIGTMSLPHLQAKGVPVHVVVDDYNLLSWAMFEDGHVIKFRLDTGEILDEFSLTEEGGPALTAWSFPQRDGRAVLGFEDGSVRFVTIEFTLSFIELLDGPEEFHDLEVREVATFGNELVQLTPRGQLRIMGLSIEKEPMVDTGAGQPIVLLDHTTSRTDINYAAMTEDGRVFMQRARGRRNMMTGQVTYRITTADVEYQRRAALPAYICLTGLGDNLYVIWEDGLLNRYDTRDLNAIQRVETVDLNQDGQTRITAIGFMIGKTTLLVGDSNGNTTGWFRVRPEGVERNPNHSVVIRSVELDEEGRNRGEPREVRVAGIENPDNLALVPAWQMPGPANGSPVLSLRPSERKRLFAAGHEDGTIRVHNATVQDTQFQVHLPGNPRAEVVLLNPRDNGLIGVSDEAVSFWAVDIPHSEATLRGYFTPIWYEGYDEPSHVWQSTGGTDDFESKLGIMPLVFGTVKATLYSMIFAVPLALLAAVYTSEFLHPKAKSTIKPAVEMMASLPSVVLGFLAGLVLAQYMETRVPAALLSVITIPYGLLLAAGIWQLLPRTTQQRFKFVRLGLMMLAVPIAVTAAAKLGPLSEKMFFQVEILDATTAEEMIGEMSEADFRHTGRDTIIVSNIITWLSAHEQDPEDPTFASSPVGGWMILFMPLSFLLIVYSTIKWMNPLLLRRFQSLSSFQFALMDLLKFVLAGFAALLLAWLLSHLMGTVFSLDPRGSYISSYQQRNALVVGFIMGFAVVPIIYTIADDAMSAVPEHLRSASLGAGATRWQTAVRIIIPTSMSGLFSAVMIGFGRAVGETMIVLMAAGNTPIMEWNIFSGFRTLSANIAVEMMEAVENSTNYRTLFLTAVILFTMTFIINTVAEKVRQNYRKKAYQL